ncbi:purine-nucleoside phosphorylase [Peptoniphilaceae bacterium SGI.137]|nr:purine-nucleoside phosphorylase [Peptoniphilaceae bacterium]MCI6660449.1 purine-nucleoside phosphorylase [Peptoniphilaceae bacterium]MDY3986309.1 purine-nucleoside phosphorylase [Peptoniphilaceae bacterium]MDY4196916.1 purine-nucleoside phosphorylase [Peptoniphilaceae bacterium]MDY5842321.1 purine-nucleoside phosphorylase [Peptoniphilaceae bacterium]
MPTPHNTAEKGQIAGKILLPGDPLRAKFVADNYLQEAKQFNSTRNMFGFTGIYRGEPVSVMGTGMGMPSLGIYVYELIHEYDVKKLIRIGSAGAYTDRLKLYDIVLAQGACTDSNFAMQFDTHGTFSAIASWSLLKKAYDVAEKMNQTVHVGNIFSSDIFYNALNREQDHWKKWAKLGCLCVEMETYALYTLAAEAGVDALSVLTISDSLTSGEETTAAQRENSFQTMMEIALNI